MDPTSVACLGPFAAMSCDAPAGRSSRTSRTSSLEPVRLGGEIGGVVAAHARACVVRCGVGGREGAHRTTTGGRSEAGLARRPHRAVLALGVHARVGRVPPRRVHRPCRRPHLLRRPLAVPRPLGDDLAARCVRPGRVDDGDVARADRSHRSGGCRRPAARADHPDDRDQRCGVRPGVRARRRVLERVRLRRCVRPGDEQDLRGRRGPAVLEAAPAEPGHHDRVRRARRAGAPRPRRHGTLRRRARRHPRRSVPRR